MDREISTYEYLLSIFSQKHIWLTAQDISKVLGAEESTVKAAIKSIYDEKELQTEKTQRIHTGAAPEHVDFSYSPDVLISLCFRLRTAQAISVRKNFTKILSEFIIKGFSLDDERLKNAGSEVIDELEAEAMSIFTP